MPTVSDFVSPRDKGSTQIEVHIEVDAADGEMALAYTEAIKAGVKGAIEGVEEVVDTGN